MNTYPHLLVLARDTSTFVDEVDVVGEQRVTTVLRDDAKRNQDSQPPAVATSLDKVDIAGVLGCIYFHSDRLLHLLIFELNSGVIVITVRVVVSKHVQSVFVALLGDKPLRCR